MDAMTAADAEVAGHGFYDNATLIATLRRFASENIVCDLAADRIASLTATLAERTAVLENLAQFMESFMEDATRPDYWLLKEWSEMARAALRGESKA
jgi:hypothetical protein